MRDPSTRPTGPTHAIPAAALPPPRGIAYWILRVVAALTLLLGAAMAALGAWLVVLGGSVYYLLAGAATVWACLMIIRGPTAARGLALFGAVVLATFAWSLWEIDAKDWLPAWGFDLAGRTGVLAGLLAAMTGLHVLHTRRFRVRAGQLRLSWLVAPALLVAGGASLYALLPVSGAQAPAADAIPAPPEAGRAGLQRGPTEWTAYGGSNLGQRYSEAAQITRGNVARLRKAWEFRTGDWPANERVFYSFQNTPLKIDDSLYVCSNSNQVFALDPGTGEQQWHFDPKVPPEAMEPLFSVACRAVAYHQAGPNQAAGTNQASVNPESECPRRILLATADSRLIALDAGTGAVCKTFGNNGTVDLAEGMGNQAIGLSSNTSGPVVVGNRVIVGQQVSDNQRRDAPGGVVRAYDVVSGKLIWAWDAQRTDRPREPLSTGETWPRGTPNVWSLISADESLGLVYLPTGNSTNDHFGGDRTAEEDEFTSAVVAVDVETGETRWHFRTVDHDLWDYDLGAQPTLMDMDIDGATHRVLLLGTKTGSIFVLDAATGKPLRPVERKPAPQGAMPGDWVAPTQPQSTALPNFAARPGRDPERMTAAHAFGVTPVDALLCRIQFHRMRYEGIYTPPTDKGLGMLLYPGTIGGLNWGGLSVNPEQQILITNNSRLANRVQLVPRAKVADQAIGDGGARPDQKIAPQAGSPYGVDRPIWLSPLGVPCNSPPWGYLAATDLRTGELLWSRPLGTGYDSGPLGIPTRLKLTIGTANIGGSVNTRSGLTFIAAAQDNYLRAFDTRNGDLLWDARLPASAQASPMTYMHKGRQYVAIAAGGHARLETTLGDHVVVFALP